MKRRRVALSWSSGKDSAWTLHAARRELLQQQAQTAGLPPFEVPIPYPCSNADYERIMSDHVEELKRRDIGHICRQRRKR